MLCDKRAHENKLVQTLQAARKKNDPRVQLRKVEPGSIASSDETYGR